MKKIYVYGHFSSANHGNEALIRGLKNILDGYSLQVFTLDEESDKRFGLGDICSLRSMKKELPRYNIRNIIGFAFCLLFGNDYFRHKIELRSVFEESEKKLFVLEMGDQYCEGREVLNMYRFLNKEIHSRGGRIIGLGCSINERVFKDKHIVKDLQQYDLIIARESMTFELLKENGVKNCLIVPDAAFAMNAIDDFAWDDYVKSTTQYIGIVVGGVAQGNADKYETLVEGVGGLIEHIIGSSNYEILLIPHVNAGSYLNDIDAEKKLYQKYNATNRVHLVQEMRADRIKCLISKCRIVVTLRTHASIAAYSSFVPVLVLGYSIKSQGIAKDIFGEYEPYIVNIMSNNFLEEIVTKYDELEKNYSRIRNYLKVRIPEYIKELEIIKSKVEELYVGE